MSTGPTQPCFDRDPLLNDQDAFEANASAQADSLPAAVAAPQDTAAPESAMLPEAESDAAEAEAAVDVMAAPACAQPIVAEPLFSDTGLSEPILLAIAEKGYLHPTPIQAQAIPVVLAGRDVLGVAQTGTGKTASFVLPMMDILSGSRARARMPRSLILEPTRELALQVAENFVLYGKHLKLNHALLIGGESLNDQKDALMKGVDVLIATPGRLLDLFERGGLLLTDCRVLVIDEADRMLDMGFIPDVEKIVGFLPKSRQTLFFSATMSPEIERLTKAFLSNPKMITVSKSATVATTIVAGLALVAEHDKREALRRLIRSEDVQNALIFCNRKRDVDVLYKSLMKHGFSVGSLHGDMPQPARFATLEKFKANDIRLLVCSDVAARGIDIGGLSHVFNFDVPHHAEDYVHRLGRTGRAGKTGRAFTLAGPEDRLAVEAIETLTGGVIPRIAVPGLDVVEWTESDGRKRRGRGSSSSASRGDRAARTDMKPALGEKQAKPKVEEARAKSAEPEGRPSRGRDRPRDTERPAMTALRPEAAAIRDEVVRRPEPAAEPARVEPRREPRRWRDDDLGPSVTGFGDDVPAFMMLPKRGHRVHDEAA
jgi:superfamily II DNA/RNA helicase